MKLNEIRKFLNTQNRNSLIISIFAFVISVFAIVYCCIVFMQKTDEQVFNENINKTVEIRISNDGDTWGYGTGCFVSSDGLVLTNKHMVFSENSNANYSIIQVRLPCENDFVDASVVKVSTEVDLATIQIERENTQYFKISNQVNNGQEIYTIGNPNGFGLSFTKGNVSSSLRNVIYNDSTIQAIQTSLVINEGNSGGPVFNQNGELVGLVSFRLKDKYSSVIQGVSFAVPAQQIAQFLKD